MEGWTAALVLEDRAGRIAGWDEQAARLFGWPAARVIGTPATDVLPTDAVRRARLAAATGDGHEPIEFVLTTPEGAPEVVHLSSAVVRGPGGELVGIAYGLCPRPEGPSTPGAGSEPDASSDAERWLRDALNAAGVGTWQHDVPRGTYRLDARSRLQLAMEDGRVTVEELLERVHPEDREAVLRDVQAALDPGHTGESTVEFRVLTPGGEIRRLSAESRTRFAGSGAGRRAVQRHGTLHDVTERRLAAAALERKDALLTQTGALAKVGTWEFDVATGRGTWSEEVARIHDVDPDASTSAQLGLTFYPGGAARVLEQALSEAILDAKPYDLELPFVSARHVTKWVRTIAVPIVEGGKVVRIQGLFQDITDRKHAEVTLHRSEAQFRQLTENIQEVFWMLDAGPAACFLYLSPAYERIWKRSCEEGMAAGLAGAVAAVHEDDRDRMRAAFDGLAATGTLDLEYRILRPDGEVRWIHDRAFPAPDADGQVDRFVGVAEDITSHHAAAAERRELEEQLRQSQKLEAIGRLAGGVAHDFNNMLNVILGHANLGLRRTDRPERLASSLREILAAAQRSRDLTRQLLAFSRRQTIAPRVLDLNASIRDFESLLRRLIGEDVALDFAAGRGLWAVSMDPSQLDQTLTNLVVNARDAMPFGGRLTIETRNVSLDDAYCASHPDARAGDFVMIAVSDTGRGMDRATLQRAFEPFFTTKPEGQGTGLGLSTVYGVARQNGGTVSLYSEPGRGTTVRVYLPRHLGSVEARTESAPAPLRRGSERILLVEDESALLALTEELLTELGYEVLAAEGPLDACALAARPDPPINLLLTDVIMPTMNGKELSERVRMLRPGIRVLYTSGYTADAIAHHGMLEPGIDFLEKPFTLDALAAKIREALDRPADPVGSGVPG